MRQVLLLNASYEPLHAISVRKALHLLLFEKAFAVEGEVQKLRTTTRIFTIPSVVRLAYYVHVPRLDASWSRQAVMSRDGWRCVYCGVTPGARKGGRSYGKSDFTLDHILPRSRGGRNTWSNTACACAACNHRKGNRMPHEAGMKLLIEPKTPRANVLVLSGQVPTEWKKYLTLGANPAR